MGEDIRTLLRVLSEDIADSANNTYAAIVAAAMFLYLGVMCMFIVILRKKEMSEEAKGNQNQGDVELGVVKQ